MMSSQILWQHSIIAMQRKSNDCNANQHDLQLKCQSIAMRISTIYNSNVNRLQCESARFAIQMSIDCNANQHDLQFKCQSIAMRISTICNLNVNRLQRESAQSIATQMESNTSKLFGMERLSWDQDRNKTHSHTNLNKSHTTDKLHTIDIKTNA